MWGPPKGWNSAPNESHHKTEVKAPACTTQKDAKSIIRQTCKRYSELRAAKRASDHYNIFQQCDVIASVSTTQNEAASGSHFTISMGDNNNPTMKWVDKRNRHKPCHPSIIVSFCCNQILPLLHDPVVTGFTEHKTGITDNNQKQIFRAHPSYRSDTGQINSIWYDWALFEVDKVQIPCQILCFLDIGRLKDSVVPPVVEGHELKSNSKCAVVRPFVSPPTILRAGIDADTEYTSFVKWGILKEKLYLFNCDMITSEVIKM